MPTKKHLEEEVRHLREENRKLSVELDECRHHKGKGINTVGYLIITVMASANNVSFTATFTLTQPDGVTAIPNEVITFSSSPTGAGTYTSFGTASTNASGIATLTGSLPAGIYDFEGVFSGDASLFLNGVTATQTSVNLFVTPDGTLVVTTS